MIEEVMQAEDRALDNLQPGQDKPETIPRHTDGRQKTDSKTQEHSLKLSQVPA